VNISYVHGICMRHDAISNSIRDEIEWLSQAHQVRLFAYACDQPQLPFTKVDDLRGLIFDPHFRSSELVVFHFGVHYPLFDALSVCPVNARRLVVFHNITPKEFIAPSHHGTADQSFKQLANLMFADHVVCDSQTNLDVMRAAGIDTPATVLPLALHSHHEPPPSKPSAQDDVVRVAFVGRFVKSKGAGELVAALDRVLHAAPGRTIALDMVGNLMFSDPLLLDEIGKAIELLRQAHGARVRVTIHGSAPEALKASLLRDADLFVLPTYHEGFCVPVLEALASGCKVISYDNSNLPAITGGLGLLVPTGDVAALAAAIADAAALVTSPAWRGAGAGSYGEYAGQVRDYVSNFAPERTRRRFLKFIRHFTH
jgi:glycosyltransferase involved in cell wall biosynthesis